MVGRVVSEAGLHGAARVVALGGGDPVEEAVEEIVSANVQEHVLAQRRLRLHHHTKRPRQRDTT